MNKKRGKILREKGITLVALVVTIIVLLILAGVALTLALGENGILGKAQHGSNTWANATKDEDAMMGRIGSDIDSLTGKGVKIPLTEEELTALANNGMSELTGNQITNNNLNNNPNVRAVLTGQVPLPTGYTYVEGTSTSEATTPTSWGVVVKDGSDNEWVWVPVNSTESIAPSDMYETIEPTSIASVKANNDESVRFAYREKAIKLASLSGINGVKLASSSSSSEEGQDEPDEPDYPDEPDDPQDEDGSSSSSEETERETVIKTVTKKSASNIIEGITRGSPDDKEMYREPALCDLDYDYRYYRDDGGFESTQKFADAIVKDYNDMIASIEKYGGFYIGRFVMSGERNNNYDDPTYGQIINQKVVRAEKTGIADHLLTWFHHYRASRGFETSSMVSTMPWGCQWDVMCLWTSKSGDSLSVSTRKWRPVWTSLPGGGQTASIHGPGKDERDKRNNIYDLEAYCTYNQEACEYGSEHTARGPSLSSLDNGAISCRDSSFNSMRPGSRPTLYFK